MSDDRIESSVIIKKLLRGILEPPTLSQIALAGQNGVQQFSIDLTQDLLLEYGRQCFEAGGKRFTPDPGGPANSTDKALNSPRGMVAYRESTRDPIFLFQTVEYGLSPHDYSAMEDLDWHCVEDGGGWHTSDAEDAEKVTNEMMEDHEIGTKHWRTEKVFAHREEARLHGQSRPYAWGEEGVGWRVYCVCANGHLAKLLLQAGAYE